MSIRGNVDVASDKHIAGARVPMHAHPALNSPPAFCGDVLVVKIHRMGTPLREVPEHEAHAIEVNGVRQWTVNSEEDIRRWMGEAWMITTDYPARALHVRSSGGSVN